MSTDAQIVEDRKARMKAAAQGDREAWQQVEDEHAAKVAAAVVSSPVKGEGVIGEDSPTEA